MNDNQDHFNVLRKINNKPKSTQRELAKELGFSLGKLNYIYVLTPMGIAEKTKLALNFMKRKMNEYDEIKKEIR